LTAAAPVLLDATAGWHRRRQVAICREDGPQVHACRPPVREHHVVGHHGLAEAPQGERTNLFGCYTFLGCGIDALTSRICPTLASPQNRAATLQTVPIAV